MLQIQLSIARMDSNSCFTRLMVGWLITFKKVSGGLAAGVFLSVVMLFNSIFLLFSGKALNLSRFSSSDLAKVASLAILYEVSYAIFCASDAMVEFEGGIIDAGSAGVAEHGLMYFEWTSSDQLLTA